MASSRVKGTFIMLPICSFIWLKAPPDEEGVADATWFIITDLLLTSNDTLICCGDRFSDPCNLLNKQVN